MKYIFRIDYDKYNTSDHFALQIEINLDKNETSNSIREEECIKKTNRINWKNMDIVEEYSKKANYELRKVRFNNAWGPNQNVQNDLDEYYNKITEAIITANNHTINQVYTNKKMNNKTWWNEELKELKKELKEARKTYKLWHNEADREIIKKKKSEFRRIQRRSQFVFEEKKCKNIEKLF